MANWKNTLLALLVMPLTTFAQTGTDKPQQVSAVPVETVVPSADTLSSEGISIPLHPLQSYYEPVGTEVIPTYPVDSIYQTFSGYGGRYGMWHYPLSWDEWCAWGLHRGLNVSLGAEVFAEFGKHARHGAGFGQHLSLVYADRLTDRLSFAVGGYMNNMYWAHENYRDAGLTAQLTYLINDHWETFVYGHKSLLPDRLVPRPLYDLHAVGDVVGGGVHYNFSPHFSIGVSVERRWLPRDTYYHPNY